MESKGVLSPEQKNILDSIIRDPKRWVDTFLNLPWKLEDKERSLLLNESMIALNKNSSIILPIMCLWAAITKPGSEILLIAPEGTQVELLFEALDKILVNNEWLNSLLTISQKKPFIKRFTNGSTIHGVSTKNSRSFCGLSASHIFISNLDNIEEDSWGDILPIIWGDSYRPRPITYGLSNTLPPENSKSLSWLGDNKSLIYIGNTT